MSDKDNQDLNQLLRDLEKMSDELEKAQKEIDRLGAQIRQPKANNSSGLPYRLPADYPAPREILRQHFPRTADQCCFKGGWGYEVGDAVEVLEFDPEINPDEKFDGISLEYAFIDKRIREELFFSRPEGSKHLVDYTGDSFRDLTRIANINENMWPELFMLNKEELLSQMELFESEFNRLKEAIVAGDETTIKEMMITSTERRKLFNKK